jgi:hypothetical protein
MNRAESHERWIGKDLERNYGDMERLIDPRECYVRIAGNQARFWTVYITITGVRVCYLYANLFSASSSYMSITCRQCLYTWRSPELLRWACHYWWWRDVLNFKMLSFQFCMPCWSSFLGNVNILLQIHPQCCKANYTADITLLWANNCFSWRFLKCSLYRKMTEVDAISPWLKCGLCTSQGRLAGTVGQLQYPSAVLQY